MKIKELHRLWGEDPAWRRLCAATRIAFSAVVLREHGEEDSAGLTPSVLSGWLSASPATPDMVVSAASALRHLLTWAAGRGFWHGRADRIRVDDTTLTKGPSDVRVVDHSGKKDDRRKTKDGSKRHGLPQALSELGSGKFRGVSLGEAIDATRKGRGGPRLPEGAEPFTEQQQHARHLAHQRHYVTGRRGDASERMVVKVCPATVRSASVEQMLREAGFTLESMHGTPLSWLPPRVPFSRNVSALRIRAQQAGYIPGDARDDAERMKVYCSPSTKRCRRTEEAFARNGLLLVELKEDPLYIKTEC